MHYRFEFKAFPNIIIQKFLSFSVYLSIFLIFSKVFFKIYKIKHKWFEQKLLILFIWNNKIAQQHVISKNILIKCIKLFIFAKYKNKLTNILEKKNKLFQQILKNKHYKLIKALKICIKFFTFLFTKFYNKNLNSHIFKNFLNLNFIFPKETYLKKPNVYLKESKNNTKIPNNVLINVCKQIKTYKQLKSIYKNYKKI
jgi:hypothetical protein